MITIRHDLDTIALILNQTFELPPFKRDYDSAFGKVAEILKKYGIVENARNLRFRFILCMQSFLIQFLKINGKQKIPLLLKSLKNFQLLNSENG